MSCCRLTLIKQLNKMDCCGVALDFKRQQVHGDYMQFFVSRDHLNH